MYLSAEVGTESAPGSYIQVDREAVSSESQNTTIVTVGLINFEIILWAPLTRWEQVHIVNC